MEKFEERLSIFLVLLSVLLILMTIFVIDNSRKVNKIEYELEKGKVIIIKER